MIKNYLWIQRRQNQQLIVLVGNPLYILLKAELQAVVMLTYCILS